MDFTISPEQWSVLFKLILAAMLGGLIGYDREKTGHPSGLRTLVIVAVASTFLITSMKEVLSSDSLSRVIQGMITGIGFLGAGTILIHGKDVRGLATAASIWGMAAIGIVIGMGIYFEAVIATLLFLLVLKLRVFENNISEKSQKRRRKVR